jgi:conjugal transfer ATP-binding protein TraC
VAKDNLLLVGRDDLFMNNPDKNTEISIFGVENYPDGWAGWINGELIGSLFEDTRRITCPFMITTTVLGVDKLDQAGTAQMKYNRAVQMSESPIGKTVSSWADKRREWEFVTRKISEGHTLVKVNYQVVLFTDLKNKEKNERELVNTFKAQKWELYKQRMVLLPAFVMSLPMGASQIYVRFAEQNEMFRTMPSFTAVNLAPWIGEWKGTPNPLQLLLGDRGQLINFNPWDNKEGNYNFAVAARSGAGKSFWIQDFLLSVLGQGGRAWVFDRGRSFERLCRLLGRYYSTQFLVFDGSERVSLNPFTNVHNWEGTEGSGSERIMIHNLLIQMAVREDGNLPAERQTWLDITLSQAWESKGREAEITDIYNILKENEDIRYHDLADAIFPFTRDGVYGAYFTGPSTIDLSDDFVVLEMKELDDRPQLQTIVLLILMMRINQTMYSPNRSNRKQVCLIDEAWKLLSYGNAATFIEEGYRTVRKYGGAYGAISQGVNDYYKSPSTLACLENADWTLLLAQKRESIDQLAKSDRLPGGEESIKLIRKLRTIKGYYSECAIIGPSGIATARLAPDKFKEMVFTTHPDDVAEFQALLAQGLSDVEALEEQVRRRQSELDQLEELA